MGGTLRRMFRRFTLVALLLVGFVAALAFAAVAPAGKPDISDQAAIQEAAGWIEHANKLEAEYHYVMTCRLRLLFFWTGRDDVGGGYVRIGRSAGDDPKQTIQVLFGSDPAKAPLSINRWGAGTEILRRDNSGQPVASAFFGFMKSSKGQSVMAMQKELSKEKNGGDHLFEGIISRVDPDRALSSTIPYTSQQDFDFHQYAEAEKAALQQLENNPTRRIRRMDGTDRSACPREGEFLSTVLELNDDALAGHSTPETLCYIYNARHYKVTLASVHTVAQKKVSVNRRGGGSILNQNYQHLQQAHFDVVNEQTRVTSAFDILLGTEGSLRGAPVQITYQPNWWFQIILNLVPDTTPPAKRVTTR
jgi:hypothetical protein